MKKQMPPTNRYYSLLQVLLFLENQLLFRDRFLEALPRRRTERETPPRAWGRPESSGDTWQYGRNTPTGVGKSSTAFSSSSFARKHPHGRGEEIRAGTGSFSRGETPPRAWGRVRFNDIRLLHPGNTPTGVGKRARKQCRRRVLWKHPHGRGEEGKASFHSLRASETPPRAWGRAGCISQNASRRRNTPTGVGKSF